MRLLVTPKLSTLGHVQVFAEDAAAAEGGEISFIAPQNNHRLPGEPRKLSETVLREEPRQQAGIARLMVGAILSSGDVSMEGLLIGFDPRARAAAYPALALREGRFFEIRVGQAGTPYTSFGDWFAWLAGGLFARALALVAGVRAGTGPEVSRP